MMTSAYLTAALRVGASVAVLVGLHAALTAVPVFAQGNPIVQGPPAETHTTTTVNVTVQAPPPDNTQISDASVTSSQAVFNTVIAPAPIGWANDLLALPDIWRTTPPDLTYKNSAISGLASLIRDVAAALLALAILARGIGIMLGRDDWSGMGRLLFAAICSAAELTFWQWGIDLNNSMTSAIAAPALPSLIKPHLVTTVDPTVAVGTVILLVVYAIVAIMLLFSLIFRLGLIDILIACGSLGLICWATEQTSYIANHYVRISTAILFSQVLIVICLRCASVLGTLGSGGVLGTLLSIAILWLARSAPATILAGSSSSQGSRIGSMVARVIARKLAH